MSQDVIFGSSGNDTIFTSRNSNLFSFDGDDRLVANWNSYEYYSVFMAGGNGNDYYDFDGDYGIIADTSGNDTLNLPGSSNDYLGAFINGQDLMLINEWSGQGVFILNAKSNGRIETITSDSGERFTSTQIEDLVYSEGYGDISHNELASLSGGIFQAENFSAVKEINTTWANLNWNNVWQQIATSGDLSDNAIAEILNANLIAELSPQALQQWNAQQGLQQLKLASYEGIEQNLPIESPVISQKAVENIALLYEAALDRMPDIEGLNYWIDKSAAGISIEDIAYNFIQSEEFITNFSVSSDEEFIDQMYLNVLGRPADNEGKEYWLEELDQGLTQVEVLNSFAISDENIANADWLAGLNENDGNWIF